MSTPFRDELTAATTRIAELVETNERLAARVAEAENHPTTKPAVEKENQELYIELYEARRELNEARRKIEALTKRPPERVKGRDNTVFVVWALGALVELAVVLFRNC